MENNKIKIFLEEFMASWQTAKIYETSHPKFIDSVTYAYRSLVSLLEEKEEVVLGVVEEELTSGEDIFFDLSKKAASAIINLKDKGIEKIIFRKGISKEEIIKFISFLLVPKEELQNEPQEYLSLLGIENILVGKLKVKDLGPRAKGKEEVNKSTIYEDCLDKVSLFLDTLINEDKVNFVKLKLIANNIMENLIDNYQIFFKLSQIKRRESITFVHLLNVSILSIFFAHKLGFGRNDCLDIGVAALFHDVGKLYIAKRIIQKTTKLDEEEFAKIKSHTLLGAEILLKHIDTLTILPVVVAFEHHLRYDLKGYPKIAFFRPLHIASSIVCICDVYDALNQRRSYKRDYPPEMIYKLMVKGRGKQFSPELLDTFFQIMGVWPKGTIVLLNDGKIAIVREENEGDIFRPKVEVVSPDTRVIIDLHKEQKIEIKRSLNPLGEGNKYLDLV